MTLRPAQLWQAFLAALTFMTVIPVPRDWLHEQDNKTVHGYSILFYPLIGLLLGAMLVGAMFFLSVFGSWLTAALLVLVWVILTGALHLDGLADSADAWLGGHCDRERTLTILKDTHVGVAAIVALVFMILLKAAALDEIDRDLMFALLLSPMLGRSAVLLLFATTNYVREGGLGSLISQSLPRRLVWPVLLVVVVITVVLMQWMAIFILISVALSFWLFRLLLVRRLGGTTGDTAGAVLELTELVVLLDFAAIEFLT